MRFIPQTIRWQIMMAFLSCFVFMAIVVILDYRNFNELSRSMQFFELAEEINSSLLEMRRYEKNYFLYRHDFNYEENVTYSNQLALSIQRDHDSLVKAIGQENYDNFRRSVDNYSGLMTQLHQADCEVQDCAALQEQVRGVGQNLMVLADQVMSTQRREINALLQRMIPMPLIGLVCLMILLSFVIIYITEKVIRPLARITRESEAVAAGAFQQITPYGGDKNEIYHLVLAINRMMSELEKRQEELVHSRKIASICTLTAGIAHEINNAVNNLSLTIEALIEDGETMSHEERQKLYQDAMDQSDRTSDIVKNLLEFSRASHPKVEVFDIEELVDKTIRLLKNEMDLHTINFVKEAEDDLPQVFMDKGGIQQVLLNLFLNSVQAMDSGGSLKAVIKRTNMPGEIRIDIIDNGPGIPEEYIDRIFDPFFTTKEEGEGTGLGLSVSYSVIRKNGGRLEVKSEVGKGACFSIFLPTETSGA
jgi:two-component system NtrC family sensor kinase